MSYGSKAATALYSSLLGSVVACGWVLLGACAQVLAEELTPLPPVASQLESSNGLEFSRAYIQLQEQLQATVSAIEQNRREVRQAAAATAQGLSNALQSVQANFAAGRARDLQAIQDSKALTLKVASALAAAGFLALFIMACLQWRMSRGLARIASALPKTVASDAGHAIAALGPAEQQNLEWAGETPQLENGHHEIQQASQPAPKPRRRLRLSIERWLFPKPGDSLRRRQFRALRTAVIFGFLCSGVVAVVLYLVYRGPKP